MDTAKTAASTNRSRGLWLARGGTAAAWLGSGAILIGGVLPWANVALFGLPLALPGLLTWGAVTSGIGIFALSNTRRFPLLNCVLGVAVLIGGVVARDTIGKTVVKTLLHAEGALAPVNARLAQVTLAPIEPFPSIRPAREYVGPGPDWTLWGGAALALGSACQFAGRRLWRTCRECGTLWETDRAERLHFCPHCGVQAGKFNGCSVCFGPLRRGDLFCCRCGAAAETNPKAQKIPS